MTEQQLRKIVRVPYHASIRLGGNVVVRIDPYGCVDAPHDADILLITHAHYDHFSPDDCARVSNAATVTVCPASMRDRIPDAVCLRAGETVTLGTVRIEAVAAYNVGKRFHPAAEGWLGYVVTLDGTRYYIAGDTDDTPELRAVSCDVAFLPVGGTFTMTAREAASAATALRPAFAVPVHFGAVVGSRRDAEFFASATSVPCVILTERTDR